MIRKQKQLFGNTTINKEHHYVFNRGVIPILLHLEYEK